MSCEKTSPKNDLRFRAEIPEYGVKFRSKYRQYAIAHFPCLAKKASPKNDLRFEAEFPVKLRFLRFAVCIYGGEVLLRENARKARI